MFILSANHSELHLKSYRALSSNGKTTITLVVETTNHYELGYALRALDEVLDAQKAAAKAKAEAVAREKREATKPKPKQLWHCLRRCVPCRNRQNRGE